MTDTNPQDKEKTTKLKQKCSKEMNKERRQFYYI